MPHLKSAALMAALSLLAGCQSSLNSAKLESSTKPSLERSDYHRAQQFLPQNLTPLVKNTKLVPNWIEEGNTFWFKQENQTGHQYIFVDPLKNLQKPLFDHSKLASALLHSGVEDINQDSLSLKSLNVELPLINFTVQNKGFQCDINLYICAENQQPSVENAPGVSPDGQWQLTVEQYNLVLEHLKSGNKTQLTTDGHEGFPYGLMHPNPAYDLRDNQPYQPKQVYANWSEDSRYIMTYQIDRRNTGKYALVRASHQRGKRPETTEFYYPSAAEDKLPMAQLVLIDIEKKSAIHLQAPPVMQTYYGAAVWGWWQDDGKFVYHNRFRGNRQYFMREVDPETARVRVLVEERDDKYIDPWVQQYWALPELNAFIWSSQRDGYQHLYLYNSSNGKLKNPITQGNMTVRVIRGVDIKNQQVYFEASGKEAGRDPYFRHLYRVDLDGSNLTLLTPEAAEHDTRISPDFKYFIDTYSTATEAPISLLRSTRDGNIVRTLQKADASALFALGWQPPKPFSVLAGDGKTPLYGLMYLPSHFDPNKKYPVIDDIYTGPHNFFTPKSFVTYRSQANALAELGFVVIKMDGRGTNKRGRKFHEYSFKNLSGGSDDHVTAIKQLGERFDYLDLNRVGIFGFSAGGYDTAHAMFKYPDFFKVGVSASGNHDFRVDKAGWNEMWMGYPETPEWDAQSNLNWAKHLQGKLLIAHGELDTNVHPAATIQLADALMKANKDFDLMIYPNMGHVLDKNPYFVRQRWDYFVRHLLGMEPPKSYLITK
ncbi:DPP IV N-terminal domain-containing protein [Pseudoalteromonas luteoviolacea]|uniref:S9 family peptidase n=1 Tax=Pseudoalteromonas luteoviolacea TaxID=43657 RepID=UPI001B38056B|nr:DPP IV N-terminal domain-containing protein [Pseudoalteromonas luteoviolacea]MBQ4810179.1 DPP IV N-terminal domain-containing protein [Pseudoalteromonas luteoviolacea]